MHTHQNNSFFSVAPFSLPRSTTKDFVYDGKLIKTGTTIFLNAWACNRGKQKLFTFRDHGYP
jgi:cytochrome P450